MERKAHKTPGNPRTVVAAGAVRIGHDPFPVIAGPCAIESESQLRSVAEAVADSGASILRGGAWKSAASPYDFRGLGDEAVKLLAAAGNDLGLPTVTQVLEAGHVEIAADSLAERRAAISLGMATDAMIAMIATTIMSSMRVKPAFLRRLIIMVFVFAVSLSRAV